MKKTIPHFGLALLLSVLAVSLSTCKKYPENTIWFKNVKKIPFFKGTMKLTKYTVNGIDSLELLNSYFGSGVSVKDIDQCRFEQATIALAGDAPGAILRTSYKTGIATLEITCSYSKNKKEIAIWYGWPGNGDTAVFHRNIFVNNETPWEIVKLIPDGTRKIKKTVNGNTYELQFDQE